MSTMVKRVAQALQQEMGTAAFDETASFALARAAIAAMRDPTEEMVDAWIRAPGGLASHDRRRRGGEISAAATDGIQKFYPLGRDERSISSPNSFRSPPHSHCSPPASVQWD